MQALPKAQGQANEKSALEGRRGRCRNALLSCLLRSIDHAEAAESPDQGPKQETRNALLSAPEQATN